MWILNLLQELGFSFFSPPKLLCDNLGVTHLNYNPVNHSRMKHIQIDLHFVRDLVHRGILQVHHVHTDDQLADLLTKPLSKQRTVFLRIKIGLADGSSILKGRIKESIQTQEKSANWLQWIKQLQQSTLLLNHATATSNRNGNFKQRLQLYMETASYN